MEQTARSRLPAAVEAARSRIAAWRTQRRHRRVPMPEPLWETAARLAGTHGIGAVARALGLDFYGLKRRVVNVKTRTTATPPVFVDLGVGAISGGPGCVVELQAAGDAKLTVRLPDSATLDLVSLAEILWRSQR